MRYQKSGKRTFKIHTNFNRKKFCFLHQRFFRTCKFFDKIKCTFCKTEYYQKASIIPIKENMYLVGFFDRILKYCLSSDISSKKVFFDSPNNEMEKVYYRCRFWSNSWSRMGHGVELLDLGHLMVLSHSMHFLDIKGVAHARQRWTLTVSAPCGINKLPNRVSLLNTLD